MTFDPWVELRKAISVGGCLAIDCESTGLADDAEILEIAVVDIGRDRVVFESFVRPRGLVAATEIHGITERDIFAAPCWPQVYCKLQVILARHPHAALVAWNAAFDRRLIENSCSDWGLEPFRRDWVCAMNAWNPHCRTSLDNARRSLDIGVAPKHRARADAITLARVLQSDHGAAHDGAIFDDVHASAHEEVVAAMHPGPHEDIHAVTHPAAHEPAPAAIPPAAISAA